MMLKGLKINECNKCVYIKSTQNRYVMVYLYINNKIIMNNNDNIIQIGRVCERVSLK